MARSLKNPFVWTTTCDKVDDKAVPSATRSPSRPGRAARRSCPSSSVSRSPCHNGKQHMPVYVSDRKWSATSWVNSHDPVPSRSTRPTRRPRSKDADDETKAVVRGVRLVIKTRVSWRT